MDFPTDEFTQQVSEIYRNTFPLSKISRHFQFMVAKEDLWYFFLCDWYPHRDSVKSMMKIKIFQRYCFFNRIDLYELLFQDISTKIETMQQIISMCQY